MLHFTLLGIGIFAVHREKAELRAVPSPKRIEINANDIRRIEMSWTSRYQRPPSAEEMAGLIEDQVKEEVLYREALALGLDQEDTIVRRRMAQKMEFLTQDLATASVPDEATLRKYFEENAARYAKPGRISFRHVYFSKERRGGQLEAAGREGLEVLAKGGDEESVGDPFIGSLDFQDADAPHITAALGSGFADQVLKLPAGTWQGPIPSSYGVHLVRVSRRADSEPAAFDEVREALARDLAEDRRRTLNTEFVARLKAQYQITVDQAAVDAALAPAIRTAQR